MLEIQPIPEDARVYVKFSYLKMLPAFIPDYDEAKKYQADKKRLENKIKELEKNRKQEKKEIKKLLQEKIDQLKKELEDKKAKESKKRDITKVTWSDVKYGIVKVKTIWGQSGASGIFLGNMRVRNEFYGTAYHGSVTQNTMPRDKAVILTNAHVAMQAIQGQTYVSKDLEQMLLVFPGQPYIRYTSESDRYGSPANILMVNSSLVMSSDFDCAIMVTSAVPHMEQYKAILGDSDNVKENLNIVSVGNPLGLQKFSSEGIVSRTDYDILKSSIGDYILKYVKNRGQLNGLLNANFWIDTPIGAGGISGSGIWALEGSEAGKVIAINSFGMVTGTANEFIFSTGKDLDPKTIYLSDWDSRSYNSIKDTAKEFIDLIFKKESFRDADFVVPMEMFKENYPSIAKQLHGGRVSVSGVHGGIPINKIKLFLQESGLDPEHFGWDKAEDKYWEK